MAVVQVRKAPEVSVFSQELDPRVIDFLADQLASRTTDVGLLTERLNTAVYYQEVDGPLNPAVAPDGTVTNAERQRRFTIEEVKFLCEFQPVKDAVAAIVAERQEWEAQQAQEQAAVDLSAKRRAKQANAERKHVPIMYGQLVELTRIVTILADQLDRLAPGSVAKMVGEIPQLPKLEEPGEHLKF